MYHVVISCGSYRAMTVKSMTFKTKDEAVIFITAQMNKILNNPEITRWDIKMD